MTADSVNLHGERLREAVRWLSRNAPVTRDGNEEAAALFVLSPLETESLIREFLKSAE